MPPALALTLLDPQLTFSEEEARQGVSGSAGAGGAAVGATALHRFDGDPLDPYDLKRLQVGHWKITPNVLPLLCERRQLDQMGKSLDFIDICLLNSEDISLDLKPGLLQQPGGLPHDSRPAADAGCKLLSWKAPGNAELCAGGDPSLPWLAAAGAD